MKNTNCLNLIVVKRKPYGESMIIEKKKKWTRRKGPKVLYPAFSRINNENLKESLGLFSLFKSGVGINLQWLKCCILIANSHKLIVWTFRKVLRHPRFIRDATLGTGNSLCNICQHQTRWSPSFHLYFN